MKPLASTGLAGVLATGLFAGGAFAGMIDLGGSGWRATWDPSLDPYVNLEVISVGDGELHLRKIAEFIQPPPFDGAPFPSIPITFTQTSSDAVNSIVFDEEIITNSTGKDWTDFHMVILNGHEAFFDPDATASSGPSGFDVFPFTTAVFSENNHEFDVFGGGKVLAGEQWTPGAGADGGALWLDVVTGDGFNVPYTVFTLKETPTDTYVPAPGVIALAGFGGLAGVGRRRRR